MLKSIALLLLCGIVSGAEEGFTPLFDGKTLDGWTLVGGKGRGYVVEDGLLVCPADGGGNLFTRREYTNFVLRLDFRMTAGSNNGVGIRAPLEGRTSGAGMEIQIRDDPSPVYAKAQLPVKNTGSLYDVIPARTGFTKPPGEWNAMEIAANGRRIEVRLNGSQILDTDLDSVKNPEVLKKHPGLARPSGHVGFLGHGTRVEFRDVRIRELP